MDPIDYYILAVLIVLWLAILWMAGGLKGLLRIMGATIATWLNDILNALSRRCIICDRRIEKGYLCHVCDRKYGPGSVL